MIFKRVCVIAPWWLDRIRAMMCWHPTCQIAICDPHHLGRCRHRDDWVIPLCRRHHTFGPDAIHVVGEWEWMKRFNINLWHELHRRLTDDFDAEAANRAVGAE